VTAAMSSAGPRMGAAEWALLTLHSVLWGSSYFFIDIARTELPVLTITAFRLIPALAVMGLVLRAYRLRMPSETARWVPFVPLALFNNVGPTILIVLAQREVTGGLAAVLNATTPLFGVFLAHMLTADERLSGSKLAGILVGIAGVAIVVGPDALHGSAAGLIAKLSLLGAALCYALAAIYARRRFTGVAPLVVATGQIACGLAISLPLALIIDRSWTLPWPSLPATGAVLGMGIINSAFAAICYFSLVRRAGATNALLVTLLLPLTPIVLGNLVLGQTLAPREIWGAAVISLALIVIDGRLWRWLARQWRP